MCIQKALVNASSTFGSLRSMRSLMFEDLNMLKYFVRLWINTREISVSINIF